MEREGEDPQARRTANSYLELYGVYEGWQLANQTKGPDLENPDLYLILWQSHRATLNK